MGTFLDAIHIVFQLLREPRRHGAAVVGMAVYWGAEMLGPA